MTINNAAAGKPVLTALIGAISSNTAYLSEIDGKIGDGDHGINMNKGFNMCAEKLAQREYSLSEGLAVLGNTLLDDIGGSMGPLYGELFLDMSDECAGLEEIAAADFGKMLRAGLNGLHELGGAKIGDKTLIDTLEPAVEAFDAAVSKGVGFAEALETMRAAARTGWAGTENMVARIGRASRLGERSRGVLDAGATSCYLLLEAMAGALRSQLCA